MGGTPLRGSRPGARLVSLEKDSTWRLGLLVAPAGAGKTRALQYWARQRARESGWRIAWLSLRPEHNLPGSFLIDLEACLGIPAESPGSPPEPVLCDANSVEIQGKMIELINRLVDIPTPTILVLDNYELIQTASIHQAVRLLVEYLPPEARLMIASQTEPPLQQARLRARRQLLELAPADLQGSAG